MAGLGISLFFNFSGKVPRRAVASGPPTFILLNAPTSRILLNDGTSKLRLN